MMLLHYAINNLNPPILANFAVLCFRSLIAHILCKEQILLDLLLNYVLLRDQTSMVLLYRRQLQLSHLGDFRSTMIAMMDRTQLF